MSTRRDGGDGDDDDVGYGDDGGDGGDGGADSLMDDDDSLVRDSWCDLR